MADLVPDFTNRDCSLPAGCKDLIDVLNLQTGQDNPVVVSTPQGTGAKSSKQGSIIEVRPPIPVRESAELLGQKTFKIVADLMELGAFASLGQLLDFDTSAKVISKYGASAKRIS